MLLGGGVVGRGRRAWGWRRQRWRGRSLRLLSALSGSHEESLGSQASGDPHHDLEEPDKGRRGDNRPAADAENDPVCDPDDEY